MSGAIKINGTSSGSTTITAPASGGDESIELSTALAAKLDASAYSPGLSLVATQAFSSVASVSIDNCFTSSYGSYRIIANITGASATANLYLRMRASSTDTTSGYYFAYTAGYFGNTTVDYVNGSNTSGFLAAYPNSGSSFALNDVIAPQLAQHTFATAFRINASTGGNAASGSGFLNDTTQYDGFTLAAASGTITGTVSVYGYSEA